MTITVENAIRNAEELTHEAAVNVAEEYRAMFAEMDDSRLADIAGGMVSEGFEFGARAMDVHDKIDIFHHRKSFRDAAVLRKNDTYAIRSAAIYEAIETRNLEMSRKAVEEAENKDENA